MSKTALITGASRGIGRAIALEFARNNYHLILNTKQSVQDLMELTDMVREMGAIAHPIIADVSDFKSVQEMFEEIDMTQPPVDVVINNAGISHIGLFTETTPDIWDRIIFTNLTSIYNICYQAANRMVKRQFGNIINISSIWGLDGASMEVAYSASKGGVHAFTKALAKELGPSNIRVNAIACGAIETSMNSWLSAEEKQDFEDGISLCRFGTPEEVAKLALFLASDNSSYMTGEIIRLDGGM